jgi:glycosyltransferase involved in cell wall biosynthesis
MNWAEDCAAVIPCLNEEATISSLIQGLRPLLPTVLVIDDGSTDRTRVLAEAEGAEVLCHPANRGKGAALRTGWGAAHSMGFTWAMTLDGDGQHSPEDVPAFLRCAEAHPAALVIGDRMGDAARMPWLRRRVNRWMSRRLSQAAGRPLPDSQCGCRLMNLDALATLALSTEHFEIESEVLLAFLGAHYEVRFVPIRSIYKREHSKIHPVRDTLRWLRWWRKARRRFGFR